MMIRSKTTRTERQVVVRLAGLTWDVLYRDLDDRRARPARERRDEAVHLSVEGQVFDDVALVRLERRAEIVEVYARQLRHEPIRDSARNTPRKAAVDPRRSPAAYDVVALGDLLEEDRYFGGIGC